MSEESARKLSKDNALLKAEIVKRCGSWHNPVPDLLESTPLDCFSGYPVYDREVSGKQRAGRARFRVTSELRWYFHT